jgi:hypothetical protein
MKRSADKAPRLTPKEYEKAVVEFFKTHWPPPRYTVKHDTHLRGRKSRALRQIDVSVFESGKTAPFLIAEAKRYQRNIDIVKAGSLIAFVQDIGGISTVMVCTSGFSKAARNHLWSEDIGTLVITAKEAAGWRWLSTLDEYFPIDGEFREITGQLFEALRSGDPAPFLKGTNIPYEEWLAIVDLGFALDVEKTAAMLKIIARQHFDDGWRFNAVQKLHDAGELTLADLDEFIDEETDSENVELLCELRLSTSAA